MGRASRTQAAEHRKQLVAAAGEMFRERGFGASLAELTGAVGLTVGGFYRQFSSKEALLSEATEQAFQQLQALLGQLEAAHDGDDVGTCEALFEYYLSPEHRDDAATGCPASGLCADVSRQPSGSEVRERYLHGVTDLAGWLGDHMVGAAEDRQPDGVTGDAAAAAAPDEALVALCTMVGALILARATAGSPFSERLLTTTRAALTTPNRSISTTAPTGLGGDRGFSG
ncbi:TetR/AcrR family transcriptional regulator [Streptomyces flaveolus]|uniref:TetR/AcrR family transcriptional regulator n=1 Tax=Streptomyces flaveolus TaxID=67297 RepID=A0ABV1VJ82_9ACTN